MTKHRFVYAAALISAVAASQLPEFAQQYRQRLGGAIEELGHVVSDFDRDATSSGLSRTQALDLHQQSSLPLFQARGRSMRETIFRYETLLSQREAFQTSSTLIQPFVLAYSDRATFRGAWQDFSPAVPTTYDGLLWAALGFLLGCSGAYLIAAILGLGWRRSVRAIRGRVARPSLSRSEFQGNRPGGPDRRI